jgi:hypothetical protein
MMSRSQSMNFSLTWAQVAQAIEVYAYTMVDPKLYEISIASTLPGEVNLVCKRKRAPRKAKLERNNKCE